MITETSILNGRYQLEKKIGQGGFAQVFLATDLLLERRVALKVLNPELIGDGDFLERFSREARAIATLDHPNILAIYDFGQAEGTAYLVTPYIDGGTLYEKMRQEKNIPPPVAASYLQQVASALDYAHRRNIVHRDIKPHNMLLRSEDNHIFLADFGIAKVLSSASSQSRTSAIGTISYMSPEQLAGNVGKATDIYALGCVLFQMLTGQVPFTGPTEQVIMGHIHGEIPSVVARSQGRLSPAMQAVFNRALAKQPEERYQTALEMSQAFDAALPGAGALTQTTPLPDVLAEQYAPTQFTPTELNLPPYRTPTTPTGYSQNRKVNPPPGPVYGIQPGPDPAAWGYPNQATPSNPPVYPVVGGPVNPSGYPPVQPVNPPGYPPVQPAWVNGPGMPPPSKKGPNLLLIGAAGIIIVALLAVIAVLALNNASPKPPPTQIAVITATATQNAQASQAPATSPAAAQTPVNNLGTVTPGVSPLATTTPLAPTTAVVATTAAVLTTEAATTAAPTTAPAATATANPPTATPVPPSPTIPPAPGLVVDRAAIDQALKKLPGTSSVYIILPDNQTIAVDPDHPLPSASIIKLWIAATMYEEAKAGRLDLNEKYTIQPGNVTSGTGILANHVGETYTFGQLISITLTYSDNTGANILINRLNGMEKINSYIQRNGYKETKLQRYLGDVNNPNNNFTSAKDAATFMKLADQGKIVDISSSNQILAALRDRQKYSADQNFFSTKLTGYQKFDAFHISGTGTKVRNEVGFVPLMNSDDIVIAILDADMPDESAAENAIASAVQVISQAVKP
jgi:serine/threonine-protein kinase